MELQHTNGTSIKKTTQVESIVKLSPRIRDAFQSTQWSNGNRRCMVQLNAAPMAFYNCFSATLRALAIANFPSAKQFDDSRRRRRRSGQCTFIARKIDGDVATPSNGYMLAQHNQNGNGQKGNKTRNNNMRPLNQFTSQFTFVAASKQTHTHGQHTATIFRIYMPHIYIVKDPHTFVGHIP